MQSHVSRLPSHYVHDDGLHAIVLFQNVNSLRFGEDLPARVPAHVSPVDDQNPPCQRSQQQQWQSKGQPNHFGAVRPTPQEWPQIRPHGVSDPALRPGPPLRRYDPPSVRHCQGSTVEGTSYRPRVPAILKPQVWAGAGSYPRRRQQRLAYQVETLSQIQHRLCKPSKQKSFSSSMSICYSYLRFCVPSGRDE